jgi:hypothetical protein
MFTSTRHHDRGGSGAAVVARALLAGLVVSVGLAAHGAASADNADSPPITLSPDFTIAPTTIPPTTTTSPPTTSPPTTAPPITLATTTVPPTTAPPVAPAPTAPPPPQTPPQAPMVPSPPQSPVAKAKNAAVKLTWSAPASTGGKAIDKYRVQRATSSAGPWTTVGSPTTTSFTASDLANGTTYHFRIAAHNAVGWSNPSTVVSAKPYTVPGKPQSLTATPVANGIKLTWQAPASNGGSPITGYHIAVYSVINCATKLDDIYVSGTSTTYNIADGTSRCFYVRASNAAGYGPFSNGAAAMAGRPKRPATCSLSFFPSGDYVQVSWSAPASWGGYPASGYHIVLTNQDGFVKDVTVSSNKTNYVWLDPAPGQWYAEVSAVNSQGEGALCMTAAVQVS